jgi:hypothetical protein
VKYLLILDAALAAMGAAMTLAVSYVCLIYGLYQNAEPKIRQGFPNLLVVSACFLALALVGGWATYGVWKRRRWLWLGQAALFVLLPCLYLICRDRLQSQ